MEEREKQWATWAEGLDKQIQQNAKGSERGWRMIGGKKNTNEYFKISSSLLLQCQLTDDAKILNYCRDTSPSLGHELREQCISRMFATNFGTQMWGNNTSVISVTPFLPQNITWV